MRKELMILSLAAVICGCGYDEGGYDYLPALPLECQSDNACKVGSERLGACVAGKCQRFCDSTDDCEVDTVCESGLCRPVVPCRELEFQEGSNLSGSYKNKRCIQVFSHTPTNAWEKLRDDDLIFDSKFVAANGAAGDFTSDNFKFDIPKAIIESGTNFSSVTFLIISYLASLVNTGKSLYECMKPRTLNEDKEYIKMSSELYENIENFDAKKYNEDSRNPLSSVFDFSNVSFDDISSKVMTICGANEFAQFMGAYLNYFSVTGADSKAAQIMEINGKPYQKLVVEGTGENAEEKLKLADQNVNDKLTKIIDALRESTSYYLAKYHASSNDDDYIHDELGNEYFMKKDLLNRDLLSAVAKEYKYSIQNQCGSEDGEVDKGVVAKLERLASFSDVFTVLTLSSKNYGREWAEQLKNVIVQDYMYKVFFTDATLGEVALKPISVCNEDYYDAVKGKNQANSNKIKYCTKDANDKDVKVTDGSNLEQMYAATYNMLLTTPANNLMVACVQGLNIVKNTKVTSLLDGTGLLKPDCIGATELLKATLGEDVKTSKGEPITTLNEFLENMSTLNINSLINPANFWIVGKNEKHPNIQNLIVIKTKSAFDTNDLIISQKVNLTTPMLSIVGGNGFAVEQNVNGNNTIRSIVKNVSGDNYINMLHVDTNSCPEGACSLSFTVNKINDTDIFSCGGVSYVLQNVSGYVVLKDSDPIGSRMVK